MLGAHVRATFRTVSTPIASGPASSPSPAPGASGDPAAPPPGGDAPVVLSADDVAAQAAADLADAAAAAANGDPPPNRREAAVRIPDVIAERNAAMEYANYWRDQALTVLKPPTAGAAPAAAAPGASQAIQPTRPAPKLTDYPAGDGQFDPVKWADALTAWTSEQIDHRATVAEQTREQRTAASTEQSTYNAKVAAFRATVPDFDIVAQNPSLPISDNMVKAIMRSDLGPQVYYHLAKNPPEAARIYRLPTDQQAAAIGRLEGKIEAGAIKFTTAVPAPPRAATPAPGAPAPRQQSRAPEPPNPGRSGGAPEVNMATCSLEDYLTQRLPQIARGSTRRG